MIDHDDDALSRLRASDPATGSHPDLHRLRQLVAQKAPASQGSDHAARVDDDLLRGPRVRGPWIAAAAVAAVALSGGGYAIGAQQAGPAAPLMAGEGNSGGTGSGVSSLEPAAPGLDLGASSMGGSDAAAREMAADSATGGDASASGMAWDPGPVRLTAGEGLPAGPGTGEVRALVSDQEPQEFLDAWVERTGFTGRPMPEGGESWYGSGSGLIDADAGQVIMVSDDGGGPLSFNFEDVYGSEYCADMYTGISEEDMAVITEEWQRAYGDDMPFPDASNCKELTGEKPTEEEAEAQAREFLSEAGLDVSTYTFTSYTDQDMKTVMVDGYPEGMEYGMLNANVSVGPEGVISAYGTVGEMASLGEYPVISATEAVARYGTRLFSSDYGVSIPEDNMPLDDTALATSEPAFDYEYPQVDAPSPGERIPLLLKDKTVTDAELVQGSLWTQSTSIQVPVWKLITSDGLYYTVLALSDEAIAYQGWGD